MIWVSTGTLADHLRGYDCPLSRTPNVAMQDQMPRHHGAGQDAKDTWAGPAAQA